MSDDEAKRGAVETIKSLRYSETEYFWINDMQPRMVMHPIKPELDGKDLAETKDPTGKRLFVEFVETVKAKGAGYVFYMWPKPGSQEPVEKVSYVKGFAPWGWIIGSGVYMDEINAAFLSRMATATVIGLLFSGVVLAAFIWVAPVSYTHLTLPTSDLV